MADEADKTIRILRKPKAGDGNANRNVWSGPVESGEFELVSTMMLQKILTSDDNEARKRLETVAGFDVEGQGVLAHDPKNDRYEIVDGAGNDDFSLVSTQMLQRILKGDDTGGADGSIEDPGEMDTGFDPYNRD
ncbi:MAG TPA: hypothetical protein PKH39_13150 [Woeseiaceae bacterium]|nr:hypothetical protein [Woeseiaceae bacterium]